MTELATSIIAAVTAFLGGGAAVGVIQTVAARRKTSAEATQINSDIELTEFRELRDELRLQRDEERQGRQQVLAKLSVMEQRDQIKTDYIYELRSHIFKEMPPPPPPWPQFPESTTLPSSVPTPTEG